MNRKRKRCEKVREGLKLMDKELKKERERGERRIFLKVERDGTDGGKVGREKDREEREKR